MLIITRRAGESIHIGNEIRIEVLDIKGNQTRIGITAPTDIRIHREEVYKRVKEQEKNLSEKDAG